LINIYKNKYLINYFLDFIPKICEATQNHEIHSLDISRKEIMEPIYGGRAKHLGYLDV
jgi:hypothetical protein